MMTKKDHFTGEVRDGFKHGHGTFVYDNRFFKYTGGWKKNVKHGLGVLVLGDGTRYEGEFHEGEMTGMGTKAWPDGGRYEGEFLEGEPHGKGTFTSIDGAKYTGEWSEGWKHGLGTLATPSNYSYTGSFTRNAITGQGVLSFASSTWEGTFSHGVLNGTATVSLATGITFKGTFEANQRTGNGQLTFNTITSHHTYDYDRDMAAGQIKVASVTQASEVTELKTDTISLRKSPTPAILVLDTAHGYRKIKASLHKSAKPRGSLRPNDVAAVRKASAIKVPVQISLGTAACWNAFSENGQDKTPQEEPPNPVGTFSEIQEGKLVLSILLPPALPPGLYLLILSDATAWPQPPVLPKDFEPVCNGPTSIIYTPPNLSQPPSALADLHLVCEVK